MSRRSTHTTREEAEHIRRASRPPSSSLSIERSERFPDCLLEIPLATPWPKQTLRFATRTYFPHNNYLPTPRRLQPIYYSCVCAILSTALQPASLTPPHSHRRLPSRGPGHTIIDRRNLSPRNEDSVYPPLSNHIMSSWDAEINNHAAKVAAIATKMATSTALSGNSPALALPTPSPPSEPPQNK